MSPQDYHYLDNAATTPVDPEIAESMARALREDYGNPSSLYPLGMHASRVLEESREILSGMLGARRIVFTGGGTESTNLAMRGQFLGGRAGATLVGAADHPSVTETARSLSLEGHEMRVYPVDRLCHPDVERFDALLDEDLRFVSILYGNNEVGTLPELSTLVDLVRKKAPRAHVHVDAVQAFCKVPLDLDRLGVDSATVAAHKIHGPKGVGALALGNKKQPTPLITGGGQEMGMRSGTENVCGIRAMVQAAELWISRMSEVRQRHLDWRKQLLDTLDEAGCEHHLLGDPEVRLANVISLAFPGVAGEVAMNHLAERGLYVSTGSACSQRGEPAGKSARKKEARTGSRILQAMDLPPEWIQGTLRISLGRLTQQADVDALCKELPAVVQLLRELGL